MAAGRGIGQGDTVAVMLPNIPAMLEAHFGVPMVGAVLNTLNTRLDPEAIKARIKANQAKAPATPEAPAALTAPTTASSSAVGRST